MSTAAYTGLVVNRVTMQMVTRALGSTATPPQLQHVFGPNWLQTFLQYQIAGESCVYYIESDQAAKQAFQLCFNAANLLVAKAIITPQSGNGG